ncbi:L-aspartate oxidase [Piscinibacter sakaiensis]|uniref:Succinate dehydrogenase, flavoprotein subunit n=1 Tax=Piscinibacter sakaiensis TaxID=1547922 RepID=A0A0K8P4A8_PISS1|nr:FAD-binding protein [Piscinibacter sakaiensis]GAP37483.1 succinate dehydrogenase, flavoprotein subunit [Piscinibacter sakaiensis]
MTARPPLRTLRTDILILGSGGAGLFAALHAHQAAPALSITVAVKGLLGKCGCTRMVQGGYNVALAPGDSVERHFMDTIEGSKWLADQDLAWTLVSTAIERIHELENELGCFFDRNPDGSVHQKAFAGQTFDRTVHKGDLTGIEIINRLAEQVWARGIDRLEEHRAIELLPADDGSGLAGVLMIDMRSGGYVLVQARAVLLATGGGPTMYKYHTPSGDKSCDGLAMALRAGLPLRDMEMVQFHPTGLLAGSGTRMTGTVLEEGLRGAGGWLLNGEGRRFMARYDPREERATRDIVSRSIDAEMRAGRTSPNGGVFLQMSHLGPDQVRRQFKGMVERCADCGFDLAGDRVEVVPTAHYMMGGVVFGADCRTPMPGLFAAGEDTGGVHGANRLGGNGVANSTVFGGIAGDRMAQWVQQEGRWRTPDAAAVEASIARHEHPFTQPPASLEPIREALYACMWDDVGIVRSAEGLQRALHTLGELDAALERSGVAGDDRAFNLSWHDWLNLKNLIAVSRVIATSALARDDSRGAHFRQDHPATGDLPGSTYIVVRQQAGALAMQREPVRFTRVAPGESLIRPAPAQGPGTPA